MKLKLDVSYHLLDVYTRFQVHISKHVKKAKKTSDWRGALLRSPSECLWPPESQTLPNHDLNQYGLRHCLYKFLFQI